MTQIRGYSQLPTDNIKFFKFFFFLQKLGTQVEQKHVCAGMTVP